MNLIYEARDDDGGLTLQTYFIDYSFKLYSDFTFFLQDPVYGDMIEQTEGRRVGGFSSKYVRRHHLGHLPLTTTLGGGFRGDGIESDLWQVIRRRRYWPLVDASMRERNFHLWGQQELRLAPMVRLVIGLRGDYFTFDVEDRTESLPEGITPIIDLVKQVRSGKALHVPLTQPHASGYAHQGILSPKASLLLNPHPDLDLFVNFGTGFHSNDARNVVINRVVRDQVELLRQREVDEGEIEVVMDSLLNFDLAHLDTRTLPRTVGGELGARTRLGDRLNVGSAVWWIDVDDEFVYAGDVGETERRGRTRRVGVDLEARMQLRPWLWGDLDLNLARGVLREAPAGADDIPLAPTFTSTGGLTVRHPGGWEGSLRFRQMNDRPANEDDSVTASGYTVFDLAAGYRGQAYKIDLAIENLFDVAWNEAQFATQSLLPGEGLSPLDPAPGPELHFTPGNPFALRVGISYFY